MEISEQTNRHLHEMKGMNITDEDVKLAEETMVERLNPSIDFNNRLREILNERYNSKFEGDEDQITYAKKYIREVYVPAKEKKELLESKNKTDRDSYRRVASIVDSVDSTWNASEIIGILKNA